MATHVKVIAVLFGAFGLLALVGAFFSSIILGVLASIVGASADEGAPVGAAVLGFTGLALSIILFVIAVPGLLAAYGLWNFRSWARVLAIVLAVVSLINWPLGTIFGIYVMAILFRKDAEALFVR
jgi:hypothetical protein